MRRSRLPRCPAKRASGGSPRPRREYNAADKNDVETLDAAMDRMQAARAMVEAAQAA